MEEHNPNHKDNVAELAIAKEAADLGLTVLKPLTEHERYDLVLGIADELLRVQCKWAACNGDVVYVRLKSSSHSPTRGYVITTYSASEIDAVAVYCGDLDRCYLLPIDLVAGRFAFSLRVSKTRNNQRAALNWAAEYEFRGAVAQLAERYRGTVEAGGSNPPSSTNQDVSSKLAVEEVGAHQFRNHFGYYAERAAAGTEILVSRRGKPHVRLGPARARSRRIRLRCEREMR
jgi:prevent-host-death family protein